MENEDHNVPSAEVSANEPMSFDSALSILNEADEAPVEETSAATEAPAGEEAVDEADQAEPSQDEAEAASDAEPEAELVLHGNAKTRLRNGQEVTIGDLKKRWEEAEEYKARLPEFETRQREIEQKAQAIAAQEQLFTRTIQQAQNLLRAKAPPKPDYAAYQRGEIDILTFTEQQANWTAFANEWQGLEQARQAHTQETERKQAETKQQRIAQERQRLIDAVPEFKTEEGFNAFRSDVLTHGTKDYGFSAEELGSLDDHRVLRVMKDAIAYRKLQADKAKVAAKVANVPPVQVQAPGRRVSPAERQAADVKTGFNRLRQTRSIDDAVAILNQLD
jgi:hypothetical protein